MRPKKSNFAQPRKEIREVRPQERVQRHTVEQIILAPMFDVPVPLMVDAFAPHDIHVPSPSTTGAHVDHWVDGDDVWIRVASVREPFWKQLLSDHVQWHPPWERH